MKAHNGLFSNESGLCRALSWCIFGGVGGLGFVPRLWFEVKLEGRDPELHLFQ